MVGNASGSSEDGQSSMTTALTVLVVEDDAIIGMLLAEMLQEMGYEVCAVAATEDDAVAYAEQFKPGLMIVDEHLGAGSGLSAVKRILRNGPVPCVFISGAPLPLEMSGTNVLQKPFVEEDLVRAIQQVVSVANAPVPHQSSPPHVITEH
jgi:two-component system, response regulator PdtaR